MPTPDYNVSTLSVTTDVVQQANVCPTPLTPPPEPYEHHEPVHTQQDYADGAHQGTMRQAEYAMNNNTGAGMAQSQEDSMYISPEASPEASAFETDISELSDKMEITQEESASSKYARSIDLTGPTEAAMREHPRLPQTPTSPDVSLECSPSGSRKSVKTADSHEEYDFVQNTLDHRISDHSSTSHLASRSADGAVVSQLARQIGVSKIDKELDWRTATLPQDFTQKRREPRYPSSLFQCESKYSGTQQSDRQIYHVNVRILTIDMDQCTCTGYLLIKGLTPEHDTLQTYFTGEIIGGPNQKYSFRTRNAEWGANEKTDKTHWARFPSWRSYSAYAKQDLDFAWPVNGRSWSDEEFIFMRWKEHFLVPDHKTRSIAGASFEGFYYICLNQLEGKISGIYFHSKSEKYQQLELKHDGEPGIWHRGVTPATEFR